MRLTAAFLLFVPLFELLAAPPPHPLFKDGTERPLRYRPDGRDFVIENGREFFNRPLYGSNTAFRVDAGDRPEFTLYLPGRGGNLRIGIKQGAAAKCYSMPRASSPATGRPRCCMRSAIRCWARALCG